MIPAGRYEILQARKADMGADLSRAIMNSVVTQISNGWNPGDNDYYFVANDNGEMARRLKSGLDAMKGLACPQDKEVSNNRVFNGDDDVAFADGDDNTIRVFSVANNELIGTGFYTAFATVVSLGNGYYEVTGLAIYRYSELKVGSRNATSDATEYKRGSYAFFADDSGKNRWYKIENTSTRVQDLRTMRKAVL